MWPFRRKRGGQNTSPKKSLSTAARGARGEKLARKHLRRAGLKLLAVNYRCPAGEVDVIALDRRTRPDTLVFVEVKTRRQDRYTSPAAAVNAEKQRRIHKAAEYFLHHKHAEDLLVRFDVVSIVLPDDGPARVEHISDAF
ncbi:MAG: YraN family protein [Phycisphaerae bacterium]|nr:YraN family protein [Phycisphaerae bacterium]